MKRFAQLLVSVLLITAILCPPALVSAAEHPQGYWPYFVAYTKAVESGNVDEILKTGDAMLAFYAKYPMNEAIAGMSYNIYYYRFENALRAPRRYDAAVNNAKLPESPNTSA